MFHGVNGVIRGPNMETLLDQKHLQSSKVKKLWEKRFYKPVNKMWSCFFACKNLDFWSWRLPKTWSLYAHPCFFWKSKVPYTSHELFIFQLMRTYEYLWWVPILQRDNLRKWKLQWSCISWEYLKLTVSHSIQNHVVHGASTCLQ